MITGLQQGRDGGRQPPGMLTGQGDQRQFGDQAFDQLPGLVRLLGLGVAGQADRQPAERGLALEVFGHRENHSRPIRQ